MSLWLGIFKQMEDPAGDVFNKIFPLGEDHVIDFHEELELENILKDLEKKFGRPDAEALEYFVLYFIENNFDKFRYDRLKEKITTSEDQEEARGRYGEFCYESEKSKLLGVDMIERVFDWNNLPSLRKEFLMKFVRDYDNESGLIGEIGINGISIDELDYKFDEFGVDIHYTEDDDGNIIDAEVSHYQKDYWSVGVNVNLRLDIHLRVNDEYKDSIQEKAEKLVKRKLAAAIAADSMGEEDLLCEEIFEDELIKFLKEFNCSITKIEAENWADCET